MKKVAILTLNGNFNYGNRLQNYALQEALKKMDVTVETIWFYEKLNLSLLKKMIKRILKIRDSYRVFRIKQFSNTFINIKKVKSIDCDYYDYVIVGSDQVWNYNFSEFDERYLLNSIPYDKSISYAASFGVSSIESSYYELFKNGISNFKYVSVREEQAKNIVEKLTGRDDVDVVVDPTMLMTPKEWLKIINKPKKMQNKKYILTYFLGKLSDERKNEIERVANENDCIVINILNKNEQYYCSTPQEFLYLEKNAFLICTDSFHSCVFAILFETPFVVFSREDNDEKMNSRLDTLLLKFKLNDRYFNGEINEALLRCNYEEAHKILNAERTKGFDFLCKALNEEIYYDKK